jgi:hypothetical protein
VSENPLLVRRGGCAIKKMSPFQNRRRRGGRSHETFLVIDHPVRSSS